VTPENGQSDLNSRLGKIPGDTLFASVLLVLWSYTSLLLMLTPHYKTNTLTILDNIPTSTWRKFLTKLRSREGGMMRPMIGCMINIQPHSNAKIWRFKINWSYLHHITLWVHLTTLCCITPPTIKY
ncbi:uncharacterized protein VP01_12481g1, partial [Puccinia sorghi]